MEGQEPAACAYQNRLERLVISGNRVKENVMCIFPEEFFVIEVNVW